MKAVEYYYDTPYTIYQKYYKLVSDYGLGGVSVWRMGLGDYNTDGSIWGSMNELFSIYAGDVDELEFMDNVPLNKSWTIKFSGQLLDEATITSAKENIAIVDEYGRLLPASYRYDSGSNSVIVSPSNSYKGGSLYYLIIGKNIRSTSGSSLSKPVIMRFRTKNSI
jgi:hypothetical protein